ncbi:MAG TPA: vWA domain-containing protein [Candidatus Ozemobacteraceae bacterium]|nr:vWA domain-containing protein [Candidatus Ozemobacteraceae bacterium]
MNGNDGRIGAWRAHWPAALDAWSRHTKLREPRWCVTAAEAAAEGLQNDDSGAMIRLNDQTVVISFPNLVRAGLDRFPLQILAHEIGHHVYCPGDLADQARLLARIRRALPTFERHAGLVANLYADLLINNRLHRSGGMNFAGLFRALRADGKTDAVWTLYMHIYEMLWSLPVGTLSTGKVTPRLRADADLGARLVRVYSRDWLQGAGRFASLLYPHIAQATEHDAGEWIRNLRDLEKTCSGADVVPDGLIEVDAGEAEGAIHPSLDPELNGLEGAGDDQDGREDDGDNDGDNEGRAREAQAGGAGQFREPYQYGELLRELGINLSPADLAITYYRERARPYLARFPRRRAPEATEEQIEGLDTWDIGSPVDEMDLFETAAVSPVIIPGVTTVRRRVGIVAGKEPETLPVDLDLYVDCSGSMPDPRYTTSYTALAGAIIILSALRAGSRVKATLWSGKNEVKTTGEFVRDERALLAILTGYLGGGTCFPIHLLRETFDGRTPKDRPVHVMVISDDGIDTMFQDDEKGVSGWETARMALERGRAGGTLALNLYADLDAYHWTARAKNIGWDISVVRTLEDLVGFAREFSRKQYERTIT